MMSKTLTTKQAAARLGVRVETIYAYVSREVLSRTLGPDGRTSRFDPAEVEALARRGRPRKGRRRAGIVDVSLATSITRIDAAGSFSFRGHDVETLASQGGFEAGAELLWTGQWSSGISWSETPDRQALQVARALPKDSPAVERFAVVASALACRRPLRVDLQSEAVIRHARTMIATFVESLPSVPGAKRNVGRKGRIAARLWPRLSALPPTPHRIAALDTALLVLADHELATSTLAARVAASTRADPFLAVIAGLAAMGGPLPGRAPARVHRLLREASEAVDPEVVVAEVVAENEGALPGYGHPVYETVDPRAAILMARVDSMARARDRRLIAAVRAAADARSAVKANVDFATGALAFAGKMPVGSAEAIFALARTAGWIAHAMEEYAEAPLRFGRRRSTTDPDRRGLGRRIRSGGAGV